jgi:hypothetical protein
MKPMRHLSFRKLLELVVGERKKRIDGLDGRFSLRRKHRGGDGLGNSNVNFVSISGYLWLSIRMESTPWSP